MVGSTLTEHNGDPVAHEGARVDTGAPLGSPLDLHKGIWTPSGSGCPRWPADLRLQNADTGALVPGRCRATNLCAYCARLTAVENAEVLAIDAMETGGPSVWAVLSTRTATQETARFYGSRRKLLTALRRRWPSIEVAAQVEFTTGYGTRSEGLRRPHWNLLIKGVDVGAIDQVRDVVTSIWCAREDAEPAGQFVGSIYAEGGLMRYLALHFNKQSQQPPEGWRGHRFLKSRGYFARPLPQLREDARRQLRFRRELWRLTTNEELADLPADVLDDAAAIALERREAQTWGLVRLVDLPSEFSDDGLPTAWEPTIVAAGTRAD
jgi:hypothetical protein